jgi:hypothetical protein
MKRPLPVLIFVCSSISALAAGCGKQDPLCPPGAREVYLKEADEALGRKARRLKSEGKENDPGRAVMFHCGYDKQPNGVYRKVDEVPLGWKDVPYCLENMVDPGVAPLVQCLEAVARTRFTSHILGGDESTSIMMQVASKVECVEFSREVDINAEKHGLHRTGPEEWVPATLWLLLQTMDKAMVPVTGPALFIIRPASGVEEACVDLPSEGPAKRCTDTSGCPDKPPGAETPDDSSSSGGDVVQPGTDPGTPSGDNP